MTSSSTLGSTSITLQFDLDRNVDAAARDVQAAIAAAGGELPPDLPAQADLPEGEPGRLADPHPLADERHAAARGGVRRGEHDPRAEDLAGARRRPGVRRRRAAAGGARAGRPGGARRAWGSARPTCAARSARPRSTRPRARIAGKVQAVDASARTTSSSTRRGYAPLVVAQSGAARRRSSGTSRSVYDERRERARRRLGRRRARRAHHRPQAAGREHHRDERAHPGALARSSRQSISPAIDDRRQQRPHADDPRVGRRRRDDARHQRVPRRPRRLRVPALWRATLVPAVAMPLSLLGTFGVMWLLRLQHRQPVADGAHHLDGVRRRRRHRRDREHHARHRARHAALRGGARGREADRLHHRVDHASRSLAVFVPILLMGGIVGRLFREFAVTLSVAVAMSALVSLTLTPMMCSRHARAPSRT